MGRLLSLFFGFYLLGLVLRVILREISKHVPRRKPSSSDRIDSSWESDNIEDADFEEIE